MIELVTQSIFGQIAALLVIASVLGVVGIVLRQPLIVSFIVVGLIAGPSVLNLVHAETDEIELLSELGIAVLLFLVGLKLDVNLIRSLGGLSLISGLAQVALTTAFGFGIALAVGMNLVEGVYIGIALSFSSTIIIVKMLSDKREIDALHGQVALGFLIVQDLVVVLAMIALAAVGMGSGEEGTIGQALRVLGAGVGLLVVVIVFVRFIAEPLTEYMARVPELLICFAIALAAIFAAGSDFAGLGKEIGGLMAGVALASTRYREAIGSRLAPLRDFLLLFFFVSLGAEIDIGGLGASVVPALLLSAFVLVGKPVIIMTITRFMGFRKRTGFLAGVSLAQISEFSLILAGLGASVGHLSDDTLGLITLVGLITIAVSSYMISFSGQLYERMEPLLGLFEQAQPKREIKAEAALLDETHDVVLLGLGRYGSAIGARLQQAGLSVLGIDFNPAAVRRGRALGIDVEYGDAGDPEFVRHLPLDGVKWVVSTVPVHEAGLVHGDTRVAIVQALKNAGFKGQVAISSHRGAEAEALRAAGADLVLEPFQDAADQAAMLLVHGDLPKRFRIEPVAGEWNNN